jgi:hypothetical protein
VKVIPFPRPTSQPPRPQTEEWQAAHIKALEELMLTHPNLVRAIVEQTAAFAARVRDQARQA